jgi:DNA-binding MarR family transcriptional regulator
MTRRTTQQDRLISALSQNDPPHRLFTAIREIRRGALSVEALDFLGRRGIEPGQLFDALGVLVISHPGGCRMSELAHALRVVASTATRGVDALVAEGLAKRSRTSEDGRVIIVEPTKRGIDMYLSIVQVTSPIIRHRLDEAMSRDEQAVLADLLERLIRVHDEANMRLDVTGA